MEQQSCTDHSGSGSSDSYSVWGSRDIWSACQTRHQELEPPSRIRSSSFTLEGTSEGLDAVMEEFRKNGKDSPYDFDEETLSFRKAIVGMGPSSAYLRQKSWPAPEKTPAFQLPRPERPSPPAADIFMSSTTLTEGPRLPEAAWEELQITQQQMRVLRSLPNAVLYPLLRHLENFPPRMWVRRQEEQECRFCRNNGERESYYRSHRLRSAGRVTCPVLRAYVCRRCGASGDDAHTLKYCPFTTPEERSNSAAMMRSVRLAAARRRLAPSSDIQDFIKFGETTPSVIADQKAYASQEFRALDPLWAALVEKLQK